MDAVLQSSDRSNIELWEWIVIQHYLGILFKNFESWQKFYTSKFVCLFVLSRTSNFSAIWRLSPLPVTGLQILTYA
jgi:hypothetical protein